jgi:hypothetical protein
MPPDTFKCHIRARVELSGGAYSRGVCSHERILESLLIGGVIVGRLLNSVNHFGYIRSVAPLIALLRGADLRLRIGLHKKAPIATWPEIT